MPFVLEAEPGTMKHTFTGLRASFPNLLIHKVINEAIHPFRVELMRRTEGGGESQLTETLRTYMLDNLLHISNQIKRYAFTNVFNPEETLENRKKDRDEYINLVLSPDSTPEDRTRQPDFTHSDKLLNPSELTVHSITFDYTGTQDRDWAQPTPERVQNKVIRQVIVGLDYLIVEMSLGHSADNPRTILSQEAAQYVTEVDLLYEMVDSYDPGKVPFHPTATSLNERQTFFNADGNLDPPITSGQAVGEVISTTRVTSPGAATT